MFEFDDRLIPIENINWVERADTHPYKDRMLKNYNPEIVHYALTVYLKYPVCGSTHFRKVYDTREERDAVYKKFHQLGLKYTFKNS